MTAPTPRRTDTAVSGVRPACDSCCSLPPAGSHSVQWHGQQQRADREERQRAEDQQHEREDHETRAGNALVVVGPEAGGLPHRGAAERGAGVLAGLAVRVVRLWLAVLTGLTGLTGRTAGAARTAAAPAARTGCTEAPGRTRPAAAGRTGPAGRRAAGRTARSGRRTGGCWPYCCRLGGLLPLRARLPRPSLGGAPPD